MKTKTTGMIGTMAVQHIRAHADCKRDMAMFEAHEAQQG